MSDLFHRTTEDGDSVLSVAPSLSEDLPAEIREGLVRRRLLAAGQPCPCGAQPFRLNRAQRRETAARKRKGLPGAVYHAEIVHEDDCPATDERLEQLAAEHGVTLRRWW